MWKPDSNYPLRLLFAGLPEHTFTASLDVADPAMTNYLSTLLSRFLHIKSLYQLRDEQDKRLEEVAEMKPEAEVMPVEGRARCTPITVNSQCSEPASPPSCSRLSRHE